MSRTGMIAAVCTNENPGLIKQVRREVVVGEFGFYGDYHAKSERRSFSKPGTLKPNIDQQVTIVAFEAVREACTELTIPLIPFGGLGENILTFGLGNLSDVPPGALVVSESGVVMRVIEQNKPCHQLQTYHLHLPKILYGKRGLLCAVEEGLGTKVRAGKEIKIIFNN